MFSLYILYVDMFNLYIAFLHICGYIVHSKFKSKETQDKEWFE